MENNGKIMCNKNNFPMPKIAISMHFNVKSFFLAFFVLIFFCFALSKGSICFPSLVLFRWRRKKRGTDCFAHLYRENVSQSFRVGSSFLLHIFHTHLVLFKSSTSIFTQYTFLLDFFPIQIIFAELFSRFLFLFLFVGHFNTEVVSYSIIHLNIWFFLHSCAISCSITLNLIHFAILPLYRLLSVSFVPFLYPSFLHILATFFCPVLRTVCTTLIGKSLCRYYF